LNEADETRVIRILECARSADQADDTETVSVPHAGSSLLTGRRWPVTDGERSFWATVVRRRTQGSESWLIGSLRTAEIAVEHSRPEEAQRILKVIGTLYPTWGSESLRREAEQLLQRIEVSQ
ncbi:MAG: hypothetical protein KDA85_18155, partial [Planctomycetaceae bacterium]|nr:hypothetical protein [Planctomycetaceae bacterium]